MRNIDLQIYEKNEGVGGTWWENRYPGLYFLNVLKAVRFILDSTSTLEWRIGFVLGLTLLIFRLCM